MDLGATVCLPEVPNCTACPLASHCLAQRHGRQREIPVPPQRPEITDVTEAAVAVQHRGRYLLRRRGESERWSGLWDFPRFAVSDEPVTALLESSVRSQTGVSIALGVQLAEIRHSVTRYRITLRCYLAAKTGGRLRSDAELAWVPPERFTEHPLSVTGRQFARRLTEGLFALEK
jgi:A/G-specific adenine glycosylase